MMKGEPFLSTKVATAVLGDEKGARNASAAPIDVASFEPGRQ